MVVFTYAADNKAKTKVQSKPAPLLSKAKSSVPMEKFSSVKQPQVIYSTDFETEGEWTADQKGTTGAIFQWVTDDYHSATYSWHVSDDEATTEADAVPINTIIRSSEITLPSEIDGTPPKVLEASYWVNVQTPNATEGGYVYDIWEVAVGTTNPLGSYWHTSTVDAYGGTGNSWWCANPDVGTYQERWGTSLQTPVLDLSGASGTVNLNFKNAPNSEPDFDYCYVEISSDGGATWTQLARYHEEHDPVAWTDATFDISAYTTANVIVRWRFTSDGGYQSAHGWHIDNVEITDGTTQFLYDDGGDTVPAVLLPQEEPYCYTEMHYDYDRFGNVWTLVDNTVIYNGTLKLLDFIGETVVIAFRAVTDGWNRIGAASGYGIYFDDLEIVGQGLATYDIAALGASGFQDAVVGKKLNLGVVVTSAGLENITGNIQWTGEILHIMGEDTTVAWPAMFGNLSVTDVKRDSIVTIPTFEAREWPIDKPGDYL